MHVYISGKESWSGMTCDACIHAICVRVYMQYVYVYPPSGSRGGSGTETREESGNGTTGIYM